jgi:hypothetical protein
MAVKKKGIFIRSLILIFVIAIGVLIVESVGYLYFEHKTPTSGPSVVIPTPTIPAVATPQQKTVLQPTTHPTSAQSSINHTQCLSDNEYADWSKNRIEKDGSSTGEIDIYDKESKNKRISFELKNVMESGNFVDFKKCDFYVLRIFDYGTIGGGVELWRYQYDGSGKKLMSLGDTNGVGTFGDDIFIGPLYSFDFHIDTAEKYLGLERGYMGGSEDLIVIKDLRTLQDIFTVDLAKVRKDYNMPFDFSLNGWVDGKLGGGFWLPSAPGSGSSPDLGGIAVDPVAKSIQVFKGPDDDANRGN